MVIKIIYVDLRHEITTTGRFPGTKTKNMDTKETAQRTETAYFIEYVYPVDAYGKQSFYFQLVRTKDCAILYANENINNVFIACWKMDIPHKDVTIW